MNTGVIHLHVKLDTGMSRLGVRDGEDLSAIVKFAEDSSHFAITGIYTHFATADEKQYPLFQSSI